MTDNINKLMAEALVECGYAVKILYGNDRGKFDNPVIYTPDDNRYPIGKICDPLADTLEGRRQADALEDWLNNQENELWNEGASVGCLHKSHHQWRLDRIKWCFEQLAEKSND